MLRELYVRDLALIEKAQLEFDSGLNVLTGETGAGKTVLVEALGLLLGGRGDSGLVRPGAEKMELEAAFDLEDADLIKERVRDEGLELDGEEIIIRRVMGSDGKGRCYVNDRMCTVGTLSRLGEYLVDIHGQHEHQRLLRPSSHLEYLDAYGSGEHLEILEAYRTLWERWRAAVDRLEKASMDEAERLREIDLLRFQVREIDVVKPEKGEMEELLRDRKRMQNREELFTTTRDGYELLTGGEEDGVLDRLGAAEALLERASSMDEALRDWPGRLRGAQEELTELSHEVRGYMESLDFEPGSLEEVESRLRALGDLARKYGRDSGEILEHYERAQARLAELENLDVTRQEMEDEVDFLQGALGKEAERLASSRIALAAKLTRETNRELKELNMAGMRFRVEIDSGESFMERGRDIVEFKVSPGKGLPYRSIAHIASGGELSRIMLALKLSLARADAVPTLVFDEVDAGIGGATADILSEKLGRISQFHQVFSITHLPQIAAYSDRHMTVTKRESAKGISTEVRFLEDDGRVEELVRMLGGDESTAREHALSLLKRKSDAESGRSKEKAKVVK
jgi:DNA repair protein RecN (Recombination protein N)